MRHSIKNLLKESIEEFESEIANHQVYRNCGQKAKMSNYESQEWTCDVTCPDKDEIEREIRKLKKNKATGDEIPAEFYKYSPKARDVLIAMIQEIWLTEIPTKEWLECKITLIHKAGDQKLPSNYRPISLLTIGEKLLSTIIMNRIKEDFNQTLHEWQTGFRKNFSCRCEGP